MFSGNRHITRRDLGWYTLVFAVCALCIYAVFPLSGHSFIKYEDALEQHVQAIAYYGMWLRDLVPSLMRGDGVPAFGLSIGYGTDVLGTLHYEAIGDPLALLAAFVPASYAYGLCVALVFVRLYLAGLAFMLFARSTLSCSRTALLIGAATYIFCGYALHSGFAHFFFLNPMICLPLVLFGLERLLAGRSPLLFIATVVLSCISNFYFSYMIALVVLVYLIWRLACRFTARHLRGTAADFGRIVGAGALGVLVSACVLLPVALFFSHGARQGVSVEVGLFYDLEYYEKMLAAMCSSGVTLTKSSFVAMGPVFLLALVSLFGQSGAGDRHVKILICTFIVFLLLPICAYVFNGFSRPMNRWVWAFSFFAAWLVSRQWDAIVAAASTKTRSLCVALVCIYALAIILLSLECGFEFSGKEALQIGSLVVGFVFSVAIVCMLSRSGRVRPAASTRMCRSAASLAVLAVVLYGAGYSVYHSQDKDLLSLEDLAQTVEENPYTKLADKIENEGSTGAFVRTSRRTHLNEQMTEGVSAVGYYWSLAQGEIARYWSELSVVPRTAGGGFSRFNDLDGRSALNELSGVRYFLAADNEALPVGAQKVEEGFSEDLDLYEDTQALPFGYTYNCELDENWYGQASALDREQGMLEGVLVEDAESDAAGGEGEEESLPETQVESAVHDVSYEISCGKGVRQEGSSFVVNKNKAKIRLVFTGDSDAETYVQINGLQVQDDESKADNEDKNTKFTISTAFSADTTSKFDYYTRDHQYYYDQHDFLVNGGYSEAPQTSATITFSKKGVYSFDSLRVVCRSLAGQAEKLNALKADSLRDVDFHKAGDSASTNRITGRIEVHDVRKFLLINLPYSDGWTAKVDGQEVALHRANTMFMGLYLDPGAHEVELSYATPGVRTGLAVSAVGVAGTVLWCAISRRKEEGDADKPACATCRT